MASPHSQSIQLQFTFRFESMASTSVLLMRGFLQVLLFLAASSSAFRLLHSSAFHSRKMSTAATDSGSNNIGSVCLLGAGPGDPDLLTVQAVKKLQSASLVIADRLVSKEILALISCELRIANKRPGCAEEAQEEINQWVIEAALAGRDVVRLKIGDPLLFGRGGEEILEFRKHKIDTIVLPGLSSSYTAPLAAMIPLTHRGTANQVLISTGYGRNATYVDLPEFHPERTIVLLMAVGRIDEIAASLLEKGYPSRLPVCIVEKATTPQQRFIQDTLENIAETAKKQEAKAPATIIIGDVVDVLRTWS